MGKSVRRFYFEKLYPFFKSENKGYILLGLLKMFSVIISLIPQVFYLVLINNVMIEKKYTLIIVVIIGYISVYFVQTLITVFNKILYNRVFLKYSLKMKTTMLKIYSKIDTREFEKYSVGELKNRIEEDVSVTEKFLTIHILDFIFSLISTIIISAILIFLNPILALISFIMIPLSFLFTKFMGKKVQKLNNERRVIQGNFDSFLFSCFTNWKELKANNLERMNNDIFLEFRDKLNPLFVKNQVYWYINRTFISFKDFFITRMNLYFIGGLLIIAGQMNVGILLVFMDYYEKLFGYITQISESNLGIKNDIPNLDRVLEFLNFPIKHKKKEKIDEENIVLKNVSFKYYEEQPFVLKNINFEIKGKEHVAIVGRSGCGKTTLAKLIMGLYQPTEGDISYGKYNTRDVSFESIGNKVGIVLQDPPLFNLTIKENLEFAKDNATEEECVDACKRANIYDFINSLPDKFNTIIGEHGIKLSGGQKQRLSLARVILKNPDIIIFDEATSSLDSENEKKVVSAVKGLSENKTVITIAHRLSTILSCDKVIVLDNGRVVGEGRHEELRHNNEIYDLLFEKQYVV